MKTLSEFLGEESEFEKGVRDMRRRLADSRKVQGLHQLPPKPKKRTAAERSYHADMQKRYDSPSKIDKGYKGD